STRTSRNPMASMYGRRSAAISGGRTALRTPIASAAGRAPPGHSSVTPGTTAAPTHTDAVATAQVSRNRVRRRRGVWGVQCGRSPYAGPPVTAAQHELPDLGGDDDVEPGADADQPLGAGQRDRVEDALQEP